MHAPLTVLALHLSQIVLYPFALLGAALLLLVLTRLTRQHAPYVKGELSLVIVLTLGMSIRYWNRDLLECLVNLFLVALAWLAVYQWTKHREWWGGLSLGLAIAMKCTAALFIPYFLLKRQWKMAMTSILFAGLFTLSPVITYGPSGFYRQMEIWTGTVITGVTQSDPLTGVLGEESFKNMSLRPAMGRYLMRLPEGHRGRVDHPLWVDLLDLSTGQARWLIRIAMLALILWAGHAMRARATDRTHPAILWECAAISLLMLLYSPLTWGQHCVGVIPACFLIVRTWVRREQLPIRLNALVYCFLCATLLLNPTFLDKHVARAIETYRPETLAIIGLLVVVLACQARARRPRQRAKHGGPVHAGLKHPRRDSNPRPSAPEADALSN